MGNDEDFEEDVVIEGSDLYNALKEMGCPDFECTPLSLPKFPENFEEFEKSKDIVSAPKHQSFLDCYKKICNYIYTDQTSKKFLNGIDELKIILTLEPLLDDHSSFMQNILDDSTSSEPSKPYLKLLSTSLIIGASLFSPKSRSSGLIIAISASALSVYRKYSSFVSLKQLSDLVSIENRLFHLQKGSLRILRDALNSKRPKKFNVLESHKLKYVQPLFETLCKTIEKCSQLFQKSSSLLVGLQSSEEFSNYITKFDNESMKLQGEITYKKLEQSYYGYILAQSDMMNLLALMYSSDSKKFSQLKLFRIITHVKRNLQLYEKELSTVFEQYKSCKAANLRRRPLEIANPKYRDLYTHVDLLSRKLQSAYGTVSSIVEDIENHSSTETEGFMYLLIAKMNDAYKSIDTARDFAEFNILVMKKLESNRIPPPLTLNYPTDLVKAEVLPVIFDADPQIMDECFEEYIKEEYIKPLCEDDDSSLEQAKMDKLFEKNFMSELKEVLVDKYRSMSEREARALLRYRKSGGQDEIMNIQLPPPPPPPLPISRQSSGILHQSNRRPVPLSRTVNVASNTTKNFEQDENEDTSQRISIKLPFGGRMPSFTIDEETFVGSGENSEEELAGSGCEDDEMSQ